MPARLQAVKSSLPLIDGHTLPLRRDVRDRERKTTVPDAPRCLRVAQADRIKTTNEKEYSVRRNVNGFARLPLRM